jgi:hypothetical protein
VPDFLTARAAGNPNAQIDPKAGASNLGAGGFGSTTFRPKTSQRVTARAAWKDGTWTVVCADRWPSAQTRAYHWPRATAVRRRSPCGSARPATAMGRNWSPSGRTLKIE